MTAEERRRLDPLVVVLDGTGTGPGVRVAEVAFTIAHEQQTSNAMVVAATLELAEPAAIGRFVHEEPVHILDGIDAEPSFGEQRKVERVEGAAEEATIERPLRERDRKERTRLPCGERRHHEREPRCAGSDQELPTSSLHLPPWIDYANLAVPR